MPPLGSHEVDINLDGDELNTALQQEGGALVPVGGKLPHSFQVPTSKLLDVIVALSPRGRNLEGKQRKQFRQTVNQRLYTKTRPGFYLEVGDVLHIAYVGQPGGANTQHHWRIFCNEQLKHQIELLIAGTALTVAQSGSDQGSFNGNGVSGNYCKEWGGLYLRSEAEVRIAEALDQAGLLFFANVRGRVGLQETIVSNGQLSGRVEVDFLIIHQGKSLVLEVDGQHHNGEGQVIRDYARDRVLLRCGLPTVRFTAVDCLKHPVNVVAEVLSILKGESEIDPLL